MSQELRLIARCDLKSGAWENISSVVKECVVQSRKEAGNHLYTAYFEQGNHNRVIFIEHWSSQEVLDLHMTTEHFQNLVKAMKPYLEQPMEVILLDEI
ncbi:Quinol monooxygenase YgiN (YgiN) (PDB:1R6Y) (PUBMED:15613473) [Commensalibacter communis]|uniref:putative quinol monooxygenase n=1 Tax=Commensalibacter communis TaxID=2972786 RepID=UPI0022FF8AFD|nr:putative quinol monooxygenase [Commensalibacter communis]CAI3949033.1 Quinol monooxygenase YgiN (YgiN) (PDB:1R6Y) (PUBMED:15613473) [Commensalibacter communis]